MRDCKTCCFKTELGCVVFDCDYVSRSTLNRILGILDITDDKTTIEEKAKLYDRIKTLARGYSDDE
jgi:hypothetical protein